MRGILGGWRDVGYGRKFRLFEQDGLVVGFNEDDDRIYLALVGPSPDFRLICRTIRRRRGETWVHPRSYRSGYIGAFLDFVLAKVRSSTDDELDRRLLRYDGG